MIKDTFLKKEIISEIKSYIKNLISDFYDGKIKQDQYDEILLLGSELIGVSFLNEFQDSLLNIILAVIERIKKELYSGECKNLNYIGMYKEVGSIVLSLKILKNKKIDMNNFVSFFQSWMDKYYQTHVDLYYRRETIPAFYDSIYGMSGMLNYYLNFECEKGEIIIGILKYLIFLSQNNEEGFPNYFIQNTPQYVLKEFDEPYLDFSMSHGILAPLIVMAKAKNHGIYINDLNEAINKLNNMYRKFQCTGKNGILNFPTRMSLKDYRRGQGRDYTFNSSWCYGNVSIVYGLMKVAGYLGNKEEYIFYKDELSKILNASIESYNLFEPVVCHGYASILMVQIVAYQETKDPRLIVTLERNLKKTLDSHKSQVIDNFYMNNYSLLEGAAGVMLAMTKALGIKIFSDSILMLT